MFSEKYQGKFASVYYNVGSNPLANWVVKCKQGEFQTVKDDILKSNVLQITSRNVMACSITTPVNPRGSLGIRLPFITLQVKNLNQYFSFEITVLDSDKMRRRIRVSNFQSTTRVNMFACSMPICLIRNWNQIQLNLAHFTERTFNTMYVETVQIQVHANCRLKRIYFTDRLYTNQELPKGYQLFVEKPALAKTASNEMNDMSATASEATLTTEPDAFEPFDYEAYAYEAYAFEATAFEATASEATINTVNSWANRSAANRSAATGSAANRSAANRSAANRYAPTRSVATIGSAATRPAPTRSAPTRSAATVAAAATETAAVTEANVEAQAEAVTDVDTETAAVTEANVEAQAEAVTDVDTETAAVTEANVEAQAEAEPDAGAA